jgi:hypothetical protein
VCGRDVEDGRELFRSRVYGVGSRVNGEFLWKCHALYVCMVLHVGGREM